MAIPSRQRHDRNHGRDEDEKFVMDSIVRRATAYGQVHLSRGLSGAWNSPDLTSQLLRGMQALWVKRLTVFRVPTKRSIVSDRKLEARSCVLYGRRLTCPPKKGANL